MSSSRLVQNRLPNLDGLRCVAILLVIVGHLRYNQATLADPSSLLRLLASFGSMGVDVFFAISGYLDFAEKVRWSTKRFIFDSNAINMSLLILSSLLFVLFLKNKVILEEFWRPFFLAEIVGLVVALGDSWLVRWCEWAWVAWVGHISYSVYIVAPIVFNTF
jgi:peptidoglycan/LPS O-acetylase OafA/YrhL